MIELTRITKSSGIRKILKTSSSLLTVWKVRNQNGALISHIQISRKGNFTHGTFTIETEFYRYYALWGSGRKMIDFLRKHDMASMTDILQNTDEDCRRAIYEYLSRREIEREKRKLRYIEDRKKLGKA